MHADEIESSRATEFGRTNVFDFNPLSQGQRATVGQDRCPFQHPAIEPGRLQGLNQVVFAVPPKHQRLTAQISSDRQIDRIAWKRLAHAHFVAIAHRETPNAIDP
jgi:hypothetical protein